MKVRIVPLELIFAFTNSFVPATCSKGNNLGGTAADLIPVPLSLLTTKIGTSRSVGLDKTLFDSYCELPGDNREGKAIYEKKYLQGFWHKIKWFPMSLTTPKPLISGIDRDRLILSDGIERCWIAKTLGRKWIKVRMPQEVCDKWDSRTIDKLRSIIQKTKRKAFYNPVLHPDLRRVKVSRPDSTRLDRIRRILGSLGDGLTGLDIGCNMGYMAHHLQRQGFDMTGIDFDENHLAIANALNETYGLNTRFINCRFNEFNPQGDYDVVFALSILYHIFFRQKEMDQVTVAKKIGTLTRSALFWESGDQPEKEKELIISYSGLSEFLSLGKTKGTGLNRELGVFLRPDTELSKIILGNYRKYIISAD
jgi:SAM-dependent methyltransferase